MNANVLRVDLRLLRVCQVEQIPRVNNADIKIRVVMIIKMLISSFEDPKTGQVQHNK